MQRIKYTKTHNNLISAVVQNIYGKRVWINICLIPVKVNIMYEDTIINFEQKSLQNAKRKVRKILKEEFEVNLQDEVRSKLCI